MCLVSKGQSEQALERSEWLEDESTELETDLKEYGDRHSGDIS